MARPAKARTTYEAETSKLMRMLRVVRADEHGSALWHESVEERIGELVHLLVSEDARRRKKR